jgi:hypothetical protein
MEHKFRPNWLPHWSEYMNENGSSSQTYFKCLLISVVVQVDATIMFPLTEEEQFIFSERANHSNQEGQVRLTVMDRIYHIRGLRTLRSNFLHFVCLKYACSQGLCFCIVWLDC